MAFCPNCGTEYQQLPVRCRCGYLFHSGASAPEPVRAQATTGKFEFSGDGFALGMLCFKLVLLSVLTLGIYSFWGRTEIRRYLWSSTRFAGQPLAYHGTPIELLKGWLLFITGAAVLYGGLILASIYLGSRNSIWPAIGMAIVSAMILPLAIHGAVRYRWSRTSWQGRRFSYRGDLVELAGVFWLGVLLTIL